MRFHHRYGDDRHAVALFEGTAQLQADAARDEELDDRDRWGSRGEGLPGRVFGERHLDIKSLRLQEVLLEFRRERVGLGEQDEELGRRLARAGANVAPASVRSARRRCASAALAPSLIWALTNFSCSTCCRVYSRWPPGLRSGITCPYRSSHVRSVATGTSSIRATALML